MKGKFKIDLASPKIIEYIRTVLVALLVVIAIVICAQAYANGLREFAFYMTIACCVVLSVLEFVNTFVIKKFVPKMIFYGLDSALILTICVLADI